MTREALLHERRIAETEPSFLVDDPRPNVEDMRAQWRQKLADIKQMLALLEQGMS